MRDISRHGAQIYTDDKLTEGHDVCFRKGPIFIAARIARCKDGVVGLQFYRELTASERQSTFHSVVLTKSGER